MGNSLPIAFAEAVTTVSADPLYSVGTVRIQDGKKYVYTQADDGIIAGQAVVLDVAASATGKKVTPSGALTDMIFGVAEMAVPDEYFFFATVGGVANVLVADALAANATLGASAAAGVLGAVAARDPFGVLLVANASGGAAIRAVQLFGTVGSDI